jgi:DNA-binding response OmpR family regulator
MDKMRKRIGVVESDDDESRALCAALERHEFRAIPLRSLADLQADHQASPFLVVILDLDCLPVTNYFLRDLKRQNPEVHIIGISSRTFHPELQEALSLYISACLAKPVDSDELIYWVKSIFQDHSAGGGSTGEQQRMNGRP